MFLTEWDQEKVLVQAVNDDHRRVATDMIKEKLPILLIAKISKISEDAVIRLANTLGVTIV